MDNWQTPLHKINSSIHRAILPRAVKVLQHCRPHLAPRVLLLTPNHIVKYGSSDSILSEARAIQFVSQNTTVPVPKILAAFQTRSGNSYFLMEKCPGVPLCNVLPDLSPGEKRSVLLQLRRYMDELRALKPPRPGMVGSTDYSSLDDWRLHGSACGPFESVTDFHKAIRGGLEFPSGHEDCDNLITAQESRSYNINYTHGDLAFRHIYYLDGRVTGIIDWESAGWYPDYWEYVMTWDSFWDNPELKNEISVFLDPFPEEQKMEEARRRLFRGM
ncbi:hypothetical protein PRK78_006171 [Emydomyces testavorans]|uniref:Aminoglycoside phosphotransferase domain-containing protein n=1 Tax=Emydomyces testavorans TaxID=2070801 RepID=A0AAF0DKX0_9EURO|nr:hypothetical protein PRK78_006171 [Emydomyces testavorans]